MRRSKRRSISKVGLHFGRINWVDPVNTVIAKLAAKGLYGRVIASCTGLTVGQVYNRCKCMGLSLKDYRSGKSVEALLIVKRYDIVHGKVNPKDLVEAEADTLKRLRQNKYIVK